MMNRKFVPRTSSDASLLSGASAACNLADVNLPDEARRAITAVKLALIFNIERRAIAAFLASDDFSSLTYEVGTLTGKLLMECLPRFVHKLGGNVALVTKFERGGDVTTPTTEAIRTKDAVRRFVSSGVIFIHLPNERLAVYVDEPYPENGYTIRVYASNDSGSFYEKWEAHTASDNFLNGRAFFADGKLLERERTYSWNDIVLAEDVKDTVRLHVETFLRNRERLKKFGLKRRRGLILAGQPGTGKTLLGKVIADNVDASFIWVSPRHIRQAESFASILTTARLVAPTILFLEDIDLFAEEREVHSSLGLGELMNQLDGAMENEDLVTIATTNRLEVVEKAIRNRPGRFDRIVQVGVMNETCRRKMLTTVMVHAEFEPHDFEYLISASDGCTGAQVEELGNTIYLMSMENGGSGGDETVKVNRVMIDSALTDMRGEQKQQVGFTAA